MRRLVGAAMVLSLMGNAQVKGPINPGQEGESRPRIKRGKPRPVETTTAPESEPVRVIISDTEGRVIEERGKPAVTGDDLIDKAKETALAFTQDLPNFTCDLIVFRFYGEGRNPKWKVEDRVTAELLYIDKNELYQNIRVKGKLLKKGSPQDTGTWSTGEYGTMQLDVLSENTKARFREDISSQVGGRQAKKYLYSVEQPNSHWRIEINNQTLYPAFTGGIWIDEENFRVLRVEMIARQIPADFTLDKAEMTVDYGMVRIAGQEYLLPVKAANLACFRGTISCTHNEIEFRNYRKFFASSSVDATDSSVTFEGEKKKPVDYIPPSLDPEPPPGKKPIPRKKK